VTLTVVTRRLAGATATLAAASVLVWSLLLLAPGDPAVRVLALRGVVEPTAAQVESVRTDLGLDRPAPVRYLTWAAGAVTGDLGTSWSTGRPVGDELGRRLPATLRLTAAAMAFAVAGALALGCAAAATAGRRPDAAARMVTTGLLAVPSFLLGLVLLDVVVVGWGRFRVVTDGSWSTVALPALTLAAGSAAAWSRLLRASLLEAFDAPFLEVARARGVGAARRFRRHVLPNALVPFLTVLGMGTAALLGGAPIVETIFTWPGVGRFTVEAIAARDVPVVQGFTLYAVVAYVAASTAVDLAVGALDPRLGTAA
jgi:glutathione transport system permease protein